MHSHWERQCISSEFHQTKIWNQRHHWSFFSFLKASKPWDSQRAISCLIWSDSSHNRDWADSLMFETNTMPPGHNSSVAACFSCWGEFLTSKWLWRQNCRAITLRYIVLYWPSNILSWYIGQDLSKHRHLGENASYICLYLLVSVFFFLFLSMLYEPR